jgi:hypothetical protein
MEDIYHDEVEQRRRLGRNVAEVSCLAHSCDNPNGRLSLLLRMMSLMMQTARRSGVDELLIAVHPKHARFYEGFLAFQVFGELKTYNKVLDHPAIALVLNFDEMEAHHPKPYRRMFGKPFAPEELEHDVRNEGIRGVLQMIYNATHDAPITQDLIFSEPSAPVPAASQHATEPDYALV